MTRTGDPTEIVGTVYADLHQYPAIPVTTPSSCSCFRPAAWTVLGRDQTTEATVAIPVCDPRLASIRQDQGTAARASGRTAENLR